MVAWVRGGCAQCVCMEGQWGVGQNGHGDAAKSTVNLFVLLDNLGLGMKIAWLQ